MARTVFATGSNGGVRKSVGAIALLDYFQMGNRKVSLVEGSTMSAELRTEE